MPLTSDQEVQVAWIQSITSAPTGAPPGGGEPKDLLAQRVDWVEKEGKKAKMLEATRGRIDRIKAGIKKAQTYELTVKGKKKGSMDKSSSKEVSDESVQFETGHDIIDVEQGLGRTKFQAIQNSQRLIVEMQEEMRKSGLFDEREINEELWDPLVREEIIPENATSDSHSRFVQMYNESVKLYEKRLDEFTQSQGVNAKLLERCDLVNGVIDATASVAQVVLVSVGAGENWSSTTQNAVQYLAQGIQTTLKAGPTILKAIAQSDLAGGLNTIPGLVGGLIEPLNPNLGDIVSSSLQTAVSGALVGQKLYKAIKNKDAGLVLEALTLLGEGIQGGFAAAAYQIAGQTNDSTGGNPDLATYNIGAAISGALKGTALVAKLTKAAVEGKSAKEIIAIVQDAAKDATRDLGNVMINADQSLLTYGKSGSLGSYTESQAECNARYGRILDDVQGALDVDELVEAFSKDEKTPDKLEELVKKQVPDEKQRKFILERIKVDLRKKKAAKQVSDEEVAELNTDQSGEEVDAELKENRKGFSKQLAAVFAMDVDPNEAPAAEELRQMHSIETLIAQMEADRAVIGMIEKIVDGGAGVLAELFPPAKIAVASKKFLKNVIAAVERSIELNNFLGVLEDSKNAHSVYGEAWVNRVKNTKVQLSKNVLDACIAAAQIIGATATCGGISSVAGLIVDKAATAGQAIADQAYKFADKAKLAAAWNKFMEAKAKPLDRTLMRQALWGNPTLSKYAAAYGAVEVGDAIAKEALRKAGITAENLADAEPAIVVKYLELKFSDDSQLLRATHEITWRPDKVELNFASWSKNLQKALNDGKLSRSGSGAVDQAFAGLESAQHDYDTENPKSEEVVKDLIDALNKLQAALHAFKPVNTDDTPHLDVKEYASQLGEKCATAMADLKSELEGIKLIESVRNQPTTPPGENAPDLPTAKDHLDKFIEKVEPVDVDNAATWQELKDKVETGDVFALRDGVDKAIRRIGRCRLLAQQLNAVNPVIQELPGILDDYLSKLTAYETKYLAPGAKPDKNDKDLGVLRADLKASLGSYLRALKTAQSGLR